MEQFDLSATWCQPTAARYAVERCIQASLHLLPMAIVFDKVAQELPFRSSSAVKRFCEIDLEALSVLLLPLLVHSVLSIKHLSRAFSLDALIQGVIQR